MIFQRAQCLPRGLIVATALLFFGSAQAQTRERPTGSGPSAVSIAAAPTAAPAASPSAPLSQAPPSSPETSPAVAKPAGPAPANDALAQVEELRKQVAALEALLQRQQLTIAEMQKQIEVVAARAPSTPATTSAANRQVRTGAVDDAPKPVATQAVPAGQQSAAPRTTPLVVGYDSYHLYLRSADGNFFTYLLGFTQLDFRGYSRGTHPPNTFLIRRARLGVEGKVLRYFEFKVEGEFADTSNTILRDAYLRIHRIDQFQVTFGHVKEPFSQEELRGDIIGDFVERSLVNNVVPSRSPGLMVSGILRKGVIEYQLGAFNGKGQLAANTSGTPESAGRLRLAPWRNTDSQWLKGLFIAGAAAYGRSGAGTTSVRGLTESRSITYFAPDAVNGKVARANAELTWLIGPAAIRTEYDQTNQARQGLGPRGTNLPGVIAKGYMGQFTYLLTGENKTDSSPVNPRRSLFGDENGNPGFGAWELKFRYSNLSINDGTAKSNRAETFYFGPNWYLNRFVRYVLDFGVERYRDPLRAPNPGHTGYFVILSRIQVTF